VFLFTMESIYSMDIFTAAWSTENGEYTYEYVLNWRSVQ
jgi:hypothetical protein